MIFLSAQPDTYYFLWQLEIQLYNFQKVGICPNDIHVLIGYNPSRGLSQEFEEFITTNKFALFFVYPDDRVNKNYLSSIRPNLIKKHFSANRFLENTVIFYHDSDILFREYPDYSTLINDSNWYVSDARSYIGIDYLSEKVDRLLLRDLFEKIGVDSNKILASNENAGGAQYILKNVTADFWNKVERDSEIIYDVLNYNNRIQGEKFFIATGKKASESQGVQAWCADMWAIYWNAVSTDISVQITPILDFCWPHDSINAWQEKNILHYAGVNKMDEGKLFCKGRYIHYPPYNDDLGYIDENSCSYVIKQLIDEYLASHEHSKIDLTDVTFLIPIRIDSEDRLENLRIIISYLNKNFNTRIFIFEADKSSRLTNIKFPENVIKFWEEDFNFYLHRTKYNNLMVKAAETPIVCMYDADVIFSVDQIVKSVIEIRQGNADYVSPYSGEFISVDKLFKKIFAKILQVQVLEMNKGKFPVSSLRSWGGAAFLNRQSFIYSGLDNQKITSWGPEDIERPKRMSILGYKVTRTEGVLFHLHHKRGDNSMYINQDDRIRLMEEYLKICSMRKAELLNYLPSIS